MTRTWVHDRHLGARRVLRDPPPRRRPTPAAPAEPEPSARPEPGPDPDPEPDPPPDPSGTGLTDLVSSATPLPAHRAVTLVEHAAAAVASLHATGAVHGRLCPRAFVLLAGPPEVVLLRPSSGAPPRPAPEQAAGGVATRRSDVYALGCVLFELLTGRPPYASTATMLALTRAGLPLPPVGAYQAWVPVALDGVIARATAAVPAHRYPDAGALAAAARAAVAEAEALDPMAALLLPVWSRADAVDPPTAPLDTVVLGIRAALAPPGVTPPAAVPRTGPTALAVPQIPVPAADLAAEPTAIPDRPGPAGEPADRGGPRPGRRLPRGLPDAEEPHSSAEGVRAAAAMPARGSAERVRTSAAVRRARPHRTADTTGPGPRRPPVRSAVLRRAVHHPALRRAVAWAATAVVIAATAGLLAALAPARSTVLTGHDGPVRVLATGRLDGRPIVVSGGQDATVRVWDVATGRPVGAPLTGHTAAVHGVATALLDGRAVAVSAADDGTVRVWDIATGAPLGGPIAVRTAGPLSVVTLAGRPVVVAADGAGGVEVRDLATGARVPAHPTDPQERVRSVAATQLGDRPVAVAANVLGAARVRDLVTGAPVGPAFPAETVSVAQLGERPVVVAGRAGATAVRDLATGAPLDGQDGLAGSGAAVVTDIGGRPAVVDADGAALRVRDLSGAPVRPPLAGHDGEIDAVATVDVAEIRVAGGPETDGGTTALGLDDGPGLLGPVVLSGGADGTVRVWDLDAPR